MRKKTKQQNNGFKNILTLLTFIVIGLICGGAISSSVNIDDTESMFLVFAVFCIGTYIGIFLQIIIHESGHLIFGLLTGYRFLSFRIGSLTLIKLNGKLCFKRLSLAGTGGQCLMSPPELKDDKIPVMLYHLGGCIMNTVTAIVFFVLFFLLRQAPFVSIIMMLLGMFGIFFALTNGIPMENNKIRNDGKNAQKSIKDPSSSYDLWLALKTTELQANGTRLKDMPDEWFSLPTDEEMQNGTQKSRSILYCERLMDKLDFKNAGTAIKHILENDKGLSGLQKALETCNLIYCELIDENRPEVIKELMTDEQKTLMKAMNNIITVIRTEYAIALLHEKDHSKAEKLKESFCKRLKSYPYLADIEFEKELLQIANSKASL